MFDAAGIFVRSLRHTGGRDPGRHPGPFAAAAGAGQAGAAVNI